MSDTILFLPLDANPDLVKGPNMVRPPAGARPPKAGGPGPKAPKVGAAASGGGGAPVPKGNKQGASMPSAKAPKMGNIGGQEYDYVPGDGPMPKGAVGKTDNGYWKVPKGAGNAAGAMPKDPNAKKPALEKPGAKDPLTGAKIAPTDAKVQQANAVTKQQPKVDPYAKTMNDPRTSGMDPYSTDKNTYKDAHPAVHYAMADKFRREGDDKMAGFHEGMAKEKSEHFTPEEHAQTQQNLQELGLHDYAKNHEPEHEVKTGEYAVDGSGDPEHQVQTGEFSVDGGEKPVADAADPAAVDVSTLDGKDGAKVPMMVTKDQHQQLADLGYSKEERANMKPEDAHKVIKEGKTKGFDAAKDSVKERFKAKGYQGVDAKGRAIFNKDGAQPVAAASDPAAVDVSTLDGEDVDLSDLEAKDGDPAKTPVAALDNKHSSKTQAELDSHKESGAKKEKELTTKHSEGERALKDKHKQRESEIKAGHEEFGRKMSEKHASAEKDLKSKHAEREKAASEKHAAKEKALTEKHEKRASELQSKYDEKLKAHTEDHRAAMDEHEKSKQALRNERAKGDKADSSKMKQHQRDMDASKELATEAKRKLEDHKANGKAKIDEHKASSAKELAAHREAAAKDMGEHKQKHAAELQQHKERTKFESEHHKTQSKRELESHKQQSEKELVDHKASSQKELDSHREEHGKQSKELQEKHKAAAVQDKHEAEQAKTQKKEQEKQAKEQEKAKQKEVKEQEKKAKEEQKVKAKQDAEAAANTRREPTNPHEEMQNSAHRAKAQKMADNIDSHLAREDLSPMEKEKLTKTRAMLDDHINSPHVPTPEMEAQLKDVEKASGEHGKKGHEGADDKTPKGGAGRSTHSGLGMSSVAHAYQAGSAAGHKVGQAATSAYAGALGHHVVQYGTTGAASAGHFLLNRTTPTEREANEATAQVAEKRHEQPGGSGAAAGSNKSGSDDETATVSAKKSIRLYVRL